MTLRTVVSASLVAVSLLLGATSQAMAQQETPTDPVEARPTTGGAQTLEDILARQRGETVDDTFRRQAIGDPDQAAPLTGQLGTLGGASDAELFRALRYNEADVIASNSGPGATVLMQDSGMEWLTLREGPLSTYGGYALLGMLGLLAVFYLLRGRIRIEHGRAGITIERFKPVERFGHWLLAGSFILLGVTGLLTLFGRALIVQLFARTEESGGNMVAGAQRFGLELLGPDGYDRAKATFATLALASKWVHNNVAWAFMLGLVLVFVMWVLQNIPNRHDLVWLAKGGGIFSKGVHPPSRKFNAGQKIIFWIVIVFGASVSLSGLSLLFPFELPMFAKTFAILNDLGLTALVGMEPLPTVLAPHQEMQLSQVWHSIVAFAMMAVILAHIYLGSVGMEGAYAAMGSGQVDLNWAREHHGLWVEELAAEDEIPPAGRPTPAE